MKATDLTPKQASDLHKEIFQIATYVNKLATRMSVLQFAKEDKLFQLVQKAEKALEALSNETYHLRTQLRSHASKRSAFQS